MSGWMDEYLRRQISLWDEREVIGNIPAQVPGKNPRLNKRQLPEAKVLIQQRMLQGFLLAGLVRLNHQLSTGIGKLDRPALALSKMFRAGLFAVDERNRQTIRQPGTKFLHQI